MIRAIDPAVALALSLIGKPYTVEKRHTWATAAIVCGVDPQRVLRALKAQRKKASAQP